MGLNQPLISFVLVLRDKKCGVKACTALLRPIFERTSTSEMKIVSNEKSKIDRLTAQWIAGADELGLRRTSLG
jgi:hypothetical protein